MIYEKINLPFFTYQYRSPKRIIIFKIKIIKMYFGILFCVNAPYLHNITLVFQCQGINVKYLNSINNKLHIDNT